MKKYKDEAIQILAVSLGFIGVSLLLSIGIGLCAIGEYIGFFPIIIGYELARKVIKFLFKIQQIGGSE